MKARSLFFVFLFINSCCYSNGFLFQLPLKTSSILSITANKPISLYCRNNDIDDIKRQLNVIKDNYIQQKNNENYKNIVIYNTIVLSGTIFTLMCALYTKH
jgi:hypothetical protein